VAPNKGVDPESGFRSRRSIERFVAGTPWEERDLARLASACLVGLTALAVAAYVASRTDSWPRQMLWIAVGVGAVLYSAIGVVRWLIAGLGTVRMVRRTVVDDLQAAVSRGSADVLTPDDVRRVVGASMQRVHRPGCAFVAGKVVEAVDHREIRARGLRSCEACAS
jgi:hypothetical protein